MKQHEVALARANEVRGLRAELKRKIKAGEVRLSEVLAEVALPPWLENEPVERLLQSVRRIGEGGTRKLCSRLGFAENKPVGKLTYRQRRLLAKELERWESKEKPASGRRARKHRLAKGRNRTFVGARQVA